MSDEPNPANPTPATVDQPGAAPATAAPEPPVDVIQALWHLRLLCCGLGAVLAVVSLSFSLFVWKQNRNLASETSARKQQATQIQANQQATQQKMLMLTKELAEYSYGKPELMEVFKRAGLSITSNATAAASNAPAATAPPASAPAPGTETPK